MHGKTSICRELLNYIPNSVVLNGGNLYRAIILALLKKDYQINELMNKLKDIDIKSVMDKLGIEIKIEDRETKYYFNGVLMNEEELQSSRSIYGSFFNWRYCR